MRVSIAEQLQRAGATNTFSTERHLEASVGECMLKTCCTHHSKRCQNGTAAQNYGGWNQYCILIYASFYQRSAIRVYSIVDTTIHQTTFVDVDGEALSVPPLLIRLDGMSGLF